MPKDTAELLFIVNDKDLANLEQYQGVMIACSGGLDSTLMLQNLWGIQKNEKKLKISVVHVNFHLRSDESDGDEEFISRFCEKRNIPFRRYDAPTLDSSSAGESTQEWARRVRYQFFEELKSEGWAIALAHHENDLAENILFRIARGCFPENLMGMQRWENGYFRPMLDIPRDTLEAFAARHNVPYRHDSSNDKLNYSRNRIRKLVLAELENIAPGATQRIVQTAKEARWSSEALKKSFSDTSTEAPKLDNYQTFKSYLESTYKAQLLDNQTAKLTMSRNEWNELFSWFLQAEDSASCRCSLGIIYKKDGRPHFSAEAGLNVNEALKKESAFYKNYGLPSKAEVVTKAGKTEVSIENSSDTLVNIEILDRANLEKRADKKEVQKIDRLFNKDLKFVSVEKELSYFIMSKGRICSIIWQNKVFDFEDKSFKNTVKTGDIVIMV